jgi:hypothetical protein
MTGLPPWAVALAFAGLVAMVVFLAVYGLLL